MEKHTNRIREIRKSKGMSLSDLSGVVGISIAYLSDIERGNRPGSELIIGQIAKHLGVSVADLRKAG